MRWSFVVLFLGAVLARQVRAQAEYRNLDGGFPVRVEDAAVTERYAFDLDLANFRFDALSAGRKRMQLEPRLSYGILPRTEIWLRVPAYYRERTITPRKGIAGVGFGGMYQFSLETLHLPAVAIASEVFIPTGPNALPPSYSFKTLLTQSFTRGRLHFNASLASFASRSLPANCRPLITGFTCGGGGGVLPPLDGPCAITTDFSIPLLMSCMPPATQSSSTTMVAQAANGPFVTHGHWLIGAAVDKTLPLESVVFVGDLFAERFEGIGRSTDWTAELGARKQLSPRVVLVGSIGRHFRGTNNSSFFVLGATFSRALQFGNHS